MLPTSMVPADVPRVRLSRTTIRRHPACRMAYAHLAALLRADRPLDASAAAPAIPAAP